MKPWIYRRQRTGFVLIVVIGMILAITVLLIGFNQRARNGLKVAEALLGAEQALNCAQAGLHIAVATIDAPKPKIHHHSNTSGTMEGSVIHLHQGTCRISMSRENGKLNVNHLIEADGRVSRWYIDRLLRLIDLLNRTRKEPSPMGYGIVPAMIDWTDNDQDVTLLPFIQHQNKGAESAGPGYTCDNRPFYTQEELHLVKGITPWVFEQLSDYTTVHGDGLISLNDAPNLVLQSLSEDMDAALARLIVERRRLQPFTSVADLQHIPGMTHNIYRSIYKYLTVDPPEPYYRVHVTGQVGGITRSISALVRKKAADQSADIIMYTENPNPNQDRGVNY
jgi:type II secretory pathway component PulK